MRTTGILETVLYAESLVGIREFYERILGLDVIAEVPSRHVFFRCGTQVLLIFNPTYTSNQMGQDIPPPHGSFGRGHVCFRANEAELAKWRTCLDQNLIPIESEVSWPNGGKSIYFRDPAGNSLELAESRIWGFT